MSESAERAPAPPGRGAPAAPTAQPPSAHVQETRLRRRPTGAPPPLPHPISVNTTAWVLLAVIIVACAFLFSEITPWLRLGDQANTWVLLRLADVRTPWLTDVANGINACRLRLGDHRARGVGRGTDHDLPALAAPGRLPRRPVLPGGPRGTGDLQRPDPAAPLRRAHHRQLGRILGAVGPGRRGPRSSSSERCTAWS